MRRRLNLRLLIWSLAVVAVGAGAFHLIHVIQVERNARWLLDYARAAKQKDVALDRYAQYLMVRKEDLDATEEYALALDEVARAGGDRWQIVSLLQPLLVRSGHRTKAREVLVDNLIAIGRWEAAVTHLDHLIAEAPTDDGKKRSELEHKRAWCLDAMGRFEAGADGYRKAIEADPTRVPAYVLLAEIYDYRLARDKEGLDVLDQAIEKNPLSADARVARFAHQRMFGTKEEASADLGAALKLEPKNPAVILAASRWAQANGDFEKARALVVEGIKNDDADESLLKEAAELELRAGHADKALELATRGLASVTKSGKQTRTVELQVFRTDLLIDAGKIDQAEAEIKAIRAQDPTSSLPDFLRARLLVEGKNCRAAAELLEKIRPRLEQDPYWNTRVNSLLGLAYLQLGDLERRIQALTRALRTDPGWPPLAISLAQASLESGQPARALELVDGIETPEAKVLAARAQLMVTLAEPPRRRNWKQVDDAYQTATAGQADNLDRVLLRADIARGRGDAERAEQTLKDEMKRQLPEPKAEAVSLWLALAEMLAARRDPERALSVLADARNRFGDSAAIRIRTIRILAARATPGDIALFGHVVDDLEHFPPDDRGRILRQLAEAWIRIGDPAAADAALRRAAAEMPTDLRTRSVQFELAVNRGQMDEARRVLGEMHVAEGPDGATVAFADAMFEARTAEDSALERLLRDVDSGPLRKQPARQALVKAVLHERLHNTRALIDDLQNAFDGGLRSASLTSRLVQILIDERRLNEASAALSMLERTGPLPVDLWNTALEVASALHDETRVRELVGARYLEEIRDPAEMIRIGQALARIDDVAGAMTCFRRAIDLAPHASEPWTAAIRHLVRRNLPSEALVLANQAKTKAPARYRTFLTAQCAEALGEWASAEASYRKALEERPKDALHRLALADFLASIDRPREATAEYRTVIADAAAPEIAARARRGLATLLAATDPAEARRTLALNGNRDSADRRLEAYLDGLDAPKRPEAIRQLESSSGLSPAERFRLIQLLELSGLTESAARQRERILTEQVETPAMLAYFIRTLLAQDRVDSADPLLDRLRQMEPNTPRTAEMTRLRRAAGATS